MICKGVGPEWKGTLELIGHGDLDIGLNIINLGINNKKREENKKEGENLIRRDFCDRFNLLHEVV